MSARSDGLGRGEEGDAMQLRVMVVDDHEVVREGIRSVLESRGGFQVVAEAESVRQASLLIETAQFDVLIVDLLLSGTSGLALVREMRRLRRPEPILVLTMHDAPEVVADALAAGATGVACKSDGAVALLDAVGKVARGSRYVSPQVPRAAVDHFLTVRTSDGPLAALSEREREIFDLIARGHSKAAIASELFISPKTVETHRAHIFAKLHIHSTCDMVRFAARHGLGDLGASAHHAGADARE
jgi:DNA-binding NarL/FixJ family response regulator